MIQVFYITRSRLSFSRAYARNIIKTAEYVSLEDDIEVTVFSSAPENKSSAQILDEKGVSHRFILDVSRQRRLMLDTLIQKRHAYDIIYFRDPFLWYNALIMRYVFGKKIVFEAHGSREWRWSTIFWRFALWSSHGVLYITKALKSYYGLSKPGEGGPCSGVELADFLKEPREQDLREELSLPLHKTLLVYAGNLLWDSTHVMFEVLKQLPRSVLFVLVGAKEEYIPRMKKRALELQVDSRVIFVPRVEMREVPKYLQAGNILVNTVTVTYPSSISSKLYEYLAAGKPNVSSPGGANREILSHNENSIVVDPPTANNYAEAIKRILNDNDLAAYLSSNAKKDSIRYTWQNRARVIAGFIRSICKS